VLTLEATIRNLEATNKDLEATIKDLKGTIKKLEATIKDLEATNKDLEATNKDLEATNKNLEATNKNLEAQLMAAQAKIAELKEVQLHMVVQFKEETDRVRREAEAKYAQLMVQIERITGEKVVVEDHLTVEVTATKTLKSEVDRLKALEPQNQRQAHKIKQLEASLHDTETTIRSLHKECEAIKTEAAQRYAHLREDIEVITGIKIVVEGELDKEHTVTNKLRQEIARLLRTIEDLKRVAEESQRHKVRNQQLETELGRLLARIEELERMVDDGRSKAARIRELEAEVEHLRAKQSGFSYIGTRGGRPY